MFERTQRLHSRGPAARGVVVDADGAMLGPDCVLVRRTTQGYRVLARDEAAALQNLLFSEGGEPNWLFRQCHRIAKALDDDQIALAQILGLRIPVGALDDWQLQRLSIAVPFVKAGFNPDEPRVPAGNPDGGQWTNGEESELALPVPVRNDSFDPDAVIPVADFSGGFHDVVVNAWLDAWQKKGIPAIGSPAIRIIGPDGRVQGYPDIMIHEPGQAIEAYEVKTGANPTFTSQQMRYIPMLQVGGHVYSTDPRITDLGLTPGTPFPPMRVGIIYTPGPGQPYVVKYLPGPFFAPGP